MTKQLEFDFEKVKGDFPYSDESQYRRDLIRDVKRQRTLPRHLKHLSSEAIKSLRFIFRGRF